MKKFLKTTMNFFREGEKESMARLNSFILVVTGLVFAFLHPDNIIMVSFLVGSGVGQKILQKMTEVKKNV